MSIHFPSVQISGYKYNYTGKAIFTSYISRMCKLHHVNVASMDKFITQLKAEVYRETRDSTAERNFIQN